MRFRNLVDVVMSVRYMPPLSLGGTAYVELAGRRWFRPSLGFELSILCCSVFFSADFSPEFLDQELDRLTPAFNRGGGLHELN